MCKLCYYDMQENKEDDGEGDLDLVRVVSRIEHDHTLSRQGQIHFLIRASQQNIRGPYRCLCFIKGSGLMRNRIGL